MATCSAPPKAPVGMRMVFWLIVGAFSTAFAEVTCSNEPFVFFSLQGYLVVLPLYSFHIIVLASLILRRGAPHWSVLYMAGVLFGLYEAYITKVLWMPTWLEESGGSPWLHIGNVAWFETIMLVLWWHPYMAFLVPLVIVERCMTASGQVWSGLPAGIQHSEQHRHRKWVGAIFLMAWLTAVGPTNLAASLLSVGGSAIVLGGSVILWRSLLHGHRYTLPQLLPGRTGFGIFTVLLVGYYLFFGLFLRRHIHPGWIGRGIILLMYLGASTLLIRGLHTRLRHDNGSSSAATRETVRRLGMGALGYVAAVGLWEIFLAFVAAPMGLDDPLTALIYLANMIGGGLLGVITLVTAAVRICASSAASPEDA